MELKNYIKGYIANDLEKSGHSLLDLEDALSKINTIEGVEKTASLLKVGYGISDLLFKLPELGGTAALIGGTGLGAALLTGDKIISAQDRKFKEKQEEIAKQQALISKLEEDYGIQ